MQSGRNPARLELEKERLQQCLGYRPERWVYIDVDKQRLSIICEQGVAAGYPVSTAEAGIDAREGSCGTPPGIHRIARKIGSGIPPRTVFRSRESTGDIWNPHDGQDDQDLILSRILTLEGLENGVNRGPGCDSLERYIYIHGTNQEDRIGTPTSKGCVRMTNADILDLFDRVEEGDPVVIA